MKELIQKYHKGTKTLDLSRCAQRELDDDGRYVTNEYWVCNICDGREIKFDSIDVALLFITQNYWIQSLSVSK
jgi:hypothetical protein